jgi:hypothetical protein
MHWGVFAISAAHLRYESLFIRSFVRSPDPHHSPSKKLESMVQMAEWWPNHFVTFFFEKKTSDINI